MNAKTEFLADFNFKLLEFAFKILQLKETPLLTQKSMEMPDFTMVSAGLVELPPYPQVFEEKHGFVAGMGLLDVLCNEIYYCRSFAFNRNNK